MYCRTDNKYNQNLMKNISGELASKEELIRQDNRATDEEYLMSPWPEYDFWKIWSSAGEGWKVKRDSNDKFKSYFFTSYYSCCKEQWINLHEIFHEKCVFHQDFKVVITISEYFKFKGPCNLELKLGLMDEKRRWLDKFELETIYRDYPQETWQYAEFKQEVSLKNIKFLKFYHGSTSFEHFDDGEVAKNIGTCLAEASLKLSFPKYAEIQAEIQADIH